jgi:hypothetical protein
MGYCTNQTESIKFIMYGRDGEPCAFPVLLFYGHLPKPAIAVQDFKYFGPCKEAVTSSNTGKGYELIFSLNLEPYNLHSICILEFYLGFSGGPR